MKLNSNGGIKLADDSNNNDFRISGNMILSVTIFVSALLLSGAIFMTGSGISGGLTSLNEELSGVGLGSGSGTQSGTAQIAPQPSAAPSPAPSPGGTAKMSELIKDAAGVEGSNDAEIVIVEYSDYQCPFCRSWFSASKSQLDKEYIETGKVQFAFKDFPLSFHPMAQTYAEASRCAGEQDKYWELHDKIFEEQGKFGSGTVSSITVDDIKSWATAFGLNAEQFNSCIDSGKYSQQVQANFNEGAQFGVSGTPSFFIGKRDGTGQLIVGAQPYGAFKQAIDSLLSG